MKSERQHEYLNPKHPLDLSVQQFEIVRNYFEKQEIYTKAMNINHQIRIEDFSQFLSPLLRVNPMILTKSLKKNLCKNTITWNDFQQILDTESVLREDILDFVMFQQQTHVFKQIDSISLRPQIKEKDQSNRIKVILPFKQNQNYYYLLLFNYQILTIIHHKTFQIVYEMKFDMKKQDFNNIEHMQLKQRSAQLAMQQAPHSQPLAGAHC